jgi:hypothetical protein
MVIQKHYMKPEKEVEIVRGQAGIGAADAKKLVEFAGKVREAFEGKKISNTISPPIVDQRSPYRHQAGQHAYRSCARVR